MIASAETLVEFSPSSPPPPFIVIAAISPW
jgi:hypothetical protein